MYFAAFPDILYDSVGNGDSKVVTNLLRRVAIRAKVKENTLVFDTYDVKEGETPEIIADKLYGDPELHWVILFMNNVTERYSQWPRNQNQFLAHVNDKYDDVNALHHYEITQASGDTSIKINIGQDNTSHASATEVTNYDYEFNLENDKRKIRLLDPAFIDGFVSEFQSLMGESDI